MRLTMTQSKFRGNKGRAPASQLYAVIQMRYESLRSQSAQRLVVYTQFTCSSFPTEKPNANAAFFAGASYVLKSKKITFLQHFAAY